VGEHDRYGEARLHETLKGLEGSVDGRLAALGSQLTAFQRGPQRDDTTVLVLQLQTEQERRARGGRAGGGGARAMSPDGGVPEHGGFLSPGSWPMAAVVSERVELRGGRSAPTLARTLARERLGPRLDDVRRNDLLLLVTELVTNAVRHGGAGGPDAPVVLHLAAAERVLRVEVCDRGPGFEPVERVPGPTAASACCSCARFPTAGASRTTRGTCVWFEFDVEPLSGPRQGGEPPRR
jgi:hypothetical protein